MFVAVHHGFRTGLVYWMFDEDVWTAIGLGSYVPYSIIYFEFPLPTSLLDPTENTPTYLPSVIESGEMNAAAQKRTRGENSVW